MCDCRKTIEASLLERFKSAAPEAEGHGVSLLGYGYSAIELAYMPYECGATYKLKKGGTKYKTTTGNMIFSFCPFCGESQNLAAPKEHTKEVTA